MKATAKAHTNIALIKYWGKRDEELFLPTNSSLSITLDRFYTVTTVEFSEAFTEDRFFLDGEVMDDQETQKVSRFLDIVRRLAGKNYYAVVDSTNHVPTAAGFASSASGYCALAGAACKAIGLNVNEQELSRIARQGSGSASRSVYGGFVEWKKGEKGDGSDSYAIPILPQDAWDLSILSVVLNTKKKKISSREGMRRTVETSCFYDGWLATVATDLNEAKGAIADRDFEKLGQVLERNALKMHATTLGANPPFFYWESATFDVIDSVMELRDQGIQAYFTIDAGPNVKVICERKNEKKVLDALQAIPVTNKVYVCHPGPGIAYL